MLQDSNLKMGKGDRVRAAKGSKKDVKEVMVTQKKIPEPKKYKAWSPDDVCRPAFLPSLKPKNYTVDEGTQSCCPVCTEILDSTDKKFTPCRCGFKLCLFCYNTLLVQDARCPSCRSQYGVL